MLPARAARLLFQLPHGCRVYTAIDSRNVWGFQEVFLNKVTHLLELLLWQNSYDPKKKAEWRAKRPKPFVPDFMKQPSPMSKELEAHPTDEIDAILSQPRG